MTTSPECPEHIGHFIVQGVLGSGGMGTVYRAFDKRLERTVAIKSINPARRMEAAAEHRFLREAQMLSKLNHPGICQVYDFIESEGHQYLVLELVDGAPLSPTSASKMDPKAILRIIRDVADALETAHQARIIHRDLKPENLMLTPRGTPKILDFGIARMVQESLQRPIGMPALAEIGESDQDRSNRTRSWAFDETEDTDVRIVDGTLVTRMGVLVGTPAYMAPEQVLGQPLTTACDIYSLGIILQTLLTGRPAYGDGLSTMDLLIRASQGAVERATELDPDIRELIDEMTRPDPSARPSAGDCAHRLVWILEKPERRRRRRLLVSLSAVAAGAVLAAGVLVLTNQWRARRQVRVAREFGQIASSIEWTMRAEHLAPAHDIGPAKEQIRARISDLERRIGDLDPQSAAPGHAAIGRAFASLGEHEKARRFLRKAWDGGVQTPELSCALGLSLSRLYQRALADTLQVSDEQLRRAAKAQAQKELKDPALDFLRGCRGSFEIPEGYVEALIALHDERWDDCRELIESIGSRPSWFYGVEALEADLIHHLGFLSDLSNHEEGLRVLAEAVQPLEKALQIGRSAPELHRSLCEIRSSLLYNQVYGLHSQLEDHTFDQALEDCQRTLAIDAEEVEATARLIQIHSLRGFNAYNQGRDPTPDYRKARTIADEAVDQFPDSGDSYWARGALTLLDTWFWINRGQEVSGNLEQCIDDFVRAGQLGVTPTITGNHVANCAFLGAMSAFWAGENPRPWVDRGLEAVEPLLDPQKFFVYPHTAAANLAFLQALWERDHGGDAVTYFDRAIASYSVVLQSDSSAVNIANLANARVEKARVLVESGRDPSPSLRLGVKGAERAIATDPTVGMPYFLLGNAHHWEAKYAIQNGDRPTASFEAGRSAFERALRVQPNDMEGYAEASGLWVTEARWLLATGNDPHQRVETGLSLARRSLELNPGFARAHRAVAELLVVRAQTADREDRSPEPFLDQARTALDAAFKTEPESARNYRILAEIHVELARWNIHHGRSPNGALGQAEGAARQALEINPENRLARNVLQEIERLNH